MGEARRRAVWSVLLAGVVLVVPLACTHGSGSPPNEVTFVLDNGTIDLEGEVQAGVNKVHVTNQGTVEHELIFVMAGGGATLPTLPNGAMDEDALHHGAAFGEIELEPGESADGVFRFLPGDYVAVCNIVSGSSVHFKNGMWMDFTVG